MKTTESGFRNSNEYSSIDYRQATEPQKANSQREALEYYKSLCNKSYSVSNSSITSLLKADHLSLSLDSLNPKDLSVFCKIITKFMIFRSIDFSLSNPNSVILTRKC